MTPTSQAETDGPRDADELNDLLTQNAVLALRLGRARKRLSDHGLGLPPSPVEAPAAPETTDETLAALRSRVAELEAAQATRLEEITALTMALEQGPFPEQLGALEAELEGLRAYAAELEHQHHLLLTSTSWRLTAPLRAAIRLVRGRSKPAPFQPRYLTYS